MFRRSGSRRWLGALLATAVVGAAALASGRVALVAQQGQQQPQPPVFRAGVNVVRVDVIVSDKDGKPVNDLKQEDFEVLEDGKPQTIDLFKLVNTDGTPGPGAEPARKIRSRYDEESEAARDDVRLFVIFLDDYHVRLGNSMRVREPLTKFLQTQLGPLDMVAIMYPLMSVNDVTFTRDKDSLASAIRKFEGRKYDYRPRNQVEEKYNFYPTQTLETLRNQITITALEGLAVRLGSLREGRKAVIFVSEGFTALLPPQMRDANASFPGNPGAPAPFARESPQEERARFMSQVDLQNLMRDIYEAANRSNTAIYALDPRGLATTEFDINENVNTNTDAETLRQSMDTLRTIADQTDGRAIVNQNDLDKGLRQIVRDTSAYYLIGYNSPVKPDGKFHKIEVKVKRPGVDMRSRKGYWAATATEAAAASAPPKPKPPAEVEKALGVMDGRPREALTTTWVQTGPGTQGRTRVTFVWEALPVPIGVTREEPVAVQLAAALPSGEMVYRGRVPEGTDAATPAPVKSARVTFEAKPGRLVLRQSVENAKGQVVDTSAQEVNVPDLTGAPATWLSVPAVYRARTAREFQALGRDPDPIPTAVREFRRTDRLLIRFDATAPGGPPDVAVRLLNRTGSKMADLVVKTPAEGVTYYQVDLPLASLPSGDFVIEVTAQRGEGKVTELVAVRVTS
jgi:VWFA-related protein